MIKKLKYNEIDWEKYQNCLENSEQYVFFAEKKYLDIIIGKSWQVLVYGDYNAVMPIPLVKKINISFVVMPLQTQQLGIFSKKDKAEINELFIHFLNKNYRVFYYAFNAKNKFLTQLKTKNNYRLISDSYENVKKNYSVHRRRNVRITDDLKNKIIFSENKNIENSKKFFLNNSTDVVKISLLEKMFKNMINLKNNHLLRVYDLLFNHQLVSQAYLLQSPKEEILINFMNDKDFLKYNTSSIILDQIFQKNISERNFNFHGSIIPKIAEFFRRFGAEEETYFYIENSKTQLLKSFFNKK